MKRIVDYDLSKKREQARAFASLRPGHIWGIRCTCTPDALIASVVSRVDGVGKHFVCPNCGSYIIVSATQDASAAAPVATPAVDTAAISRRQELAIAARAAELEANLFGNNYDRSEGEGREEQRIALATERQTWAALLDACGGDKWLARQKMLMADDLMNRALVAA